MPAVPDSDAKPGSDSEQVATGPSPCALRLTPLAAFKIVPVLSGPGQCGAVDVVRLEAVIMPDARRVPLDQPAMLRCSMAEALVHWIRDDVGPAASTEDSPLAAIASYESYQCRGRNRVAGAKLSEHGKANAIDIIGVRLASGRMLNWTDVTAGRAFRERIKASACARFMTVLGPGSDGYHEDHIHLDLAERRSGYKLCQWDVRDAEPVTATRDGAAMPKATVAFPRMVDSKSVDPKSVDPKSAETRKGVPLPLPRPAP